MGTTRADAVAGLGQALRLVRLGELGRAATARILQELAPRVADHHRVAIDPAILELIAERSLALAGTLPGKAVALLDGAAARAALMRDPEVSEIHVYLAGSELSGQR